MITPSCWSLFLQAPLHPFGQAPVLRFGLLRLGSGRPGAYGAKILRCWRMRRCSATFWGVLWVLYPNSKGTNVYQNFINMFGIQRAIKGWYPPLLDKPVWQFCLAIGQDYGIQNRNRQLASHFRRVSQFVFVIPICNVLLPSDELVH